jgi:uncharacterized membrane protein YdjX (TVP38/TMEM64 family)
MARRGAIGEGSMGRRKRAQPAPAEPTAAAATERGLARWLPLAAILGLMVLALAMGWHNYLSFKTIGFNYDLLKGFIEANLPLALAAFMLVYIAVIALSLPGGTLMTVTGGLLFGWKIAVPVTVVAATIGATIIFVVARSSFGDVFATRAGPWLGRLRDGFRENALSYLLFLRLVPAFPFFVVNLAPALLGMPLRSYVIGTFFGIIPATTAFSVAGAGLGSVVEAQNAMHKACAARHPVDADMACPYTIEASALITGELLAAFALLGVVALIPVALKKWSKPDAAA